MSGGGLGRDFGIMFCGFSPGANSRCSRSRLFTLSPNALTNIAQFVPR